MHPIKKVVMQMEVVNPSQWLVEWAHYPGYHWVEELSIEDLKKECQACGVGKGHNNCIDCQATLYGGVGGGLLRAVMSWCKEQWW